MSDLKDMDSSPESKDFRFQAKRVFLTYAQLETSPEVRLSLGIHCVVTW